MGSGFLGCGLVLAFVLGADLGVRGTLLASVLAVIPLFVVVPVYLWLDRYEAEPVRFKVFAFGWGALCAPVGALFLNTGAGILFSVGGARDPDALSAVLAAPPVEEALKGAGILLVLLLRRREFDGVIDGIVYAGLIGAGFAFSENILYLGRAQQVGGEEALTAVFVLRCVMAPFAHPLFTAFTGIGLGLASAALRSTAAKLAAVVVGFSCAVLLHAIWNLSATMGTYVTVYVAFQVPLFTAFLGLLLVLRHREQRAIGRHLSEYADAGWLTHDEVAMLASLPARRAARTWARSIGGRSALASMRSLQDCASDLALLRARMVRGSAEATAAQREAELLQAVTTHRRAFASPS